MLVANQVEDKDRERAYAVVVLSRIGLALRLAWGKALAAATPIEKAVDRARVRVERYRANRLRTHTSRESQTEPTPRSFEETMVCVDYFLDAAAEADESNHRGLAQMYREMALELLRKGPNPPEPDPSGALAMPVPREYVRTDARGSVA